MELVERHILICIVGTVMMRAKRKYFLDVDFVLWKFNLFWMWLGMWCVLLVSSLFSHDCFVGGVCFDSVWKTPPWFESSIEVVHFV